MKQKNQRFTIRIVCISMIFAMLMGCGNNHENELKVPDSSSSYEYENYQDVMSELEEVGFINIKTKILDDLITGWITKDGSVEQVSINGDTDFSADSYFSKDAKIIITYHTFPKTEESIEETAQEPELEEDGSLEIYEGAIGKPAIDIYNELERLGYKVSLKHAISKMDFTSSMQFESDPTDAESYIPWIITDVDSYSATSKTASFFINTQERIDETQSRSTAKDVLQAKLGASYAWGATDVYGNSEYPYGFKLKIATGMLAETAVDDNTWFLKAQCDVMNQNGTWMKNLVCEARVSGTSESPQIIYFNVYNP